MAELVIDEGKVSKIYKDHLGYETFGGNAGSNITGNLNTAVGYRALLSAEGAAHSNTSIGALNP